MARAAASSTAASPPTAGTDQLITAKKTPTLPSTRSIAHNAIPNNKRAGIGQAPGWLTAEISDAAPNLALNSLKFEANSGADRRWQVGGEDGWRRDDPGRRRTPGRRRKAARTACTNGEIAGEADPGPRLFGRRKIDPGPPDWGAHRHSRRPSRSALLAPRVAGTGTGNLGAPTRRAAPRTAMGHGRQFRPHPCLAAVSGRHRDLSRLFDLALPCPGAAAGGLDLWPDPQRHGARVRGAARLGVFGLCLPLSPPHPAAPSRRPSAIHRNPHHLAAPGRGRGLCRGARGLRWGPRCAAMPGF